MLPLFLPLTVLAPLAGRLTARVGPKLPMAAGLLTAAVGVGKEMRDRKTQEHFSVRDLVWDAAGAGAATWLLDRTER